MPNASRQAIVLLADGARADVFERMLNAGELPEIQRHVVDRGGHRTATSTFTSTTIPAHLPFLTGRFAGSADVPGYRWFDRRKQPRHGPLGPWSFRSYNGFESMLVDRDIADDVPTLFELAPGSQNIFGAITRGLTRGGNVAATRKNLLWLKAHFFEDYEIADSAARKMLAASLDKLVPFRFVVMPGIDWNSHYDDPFGEGAYEAYRRVDRTVGEVARKLERLGRYEKTLLAVVSDHGHEQVREHFDLGPRMQGDLGLKVAFHSMKAWRMKPDALCAISGNAMAHIYLNTVVPTLSEWLLAEPAVDIIASREPDRSILVESRRGRAELAEVPGGLTYRPIDGDPFGYDVLPRELDFETALTATADSEYPDGLLQLAQIFRSPRSGDVVVSAAPGYDLREQYERPQHRSSHGALHAAHMNVPLAISLPVVDGPARTADVFSMVLEHLQIAEPAGVDGRSRLIGAAQPSAEPALATRERRFNSNTP
ncbi:MAG: alkaline phosphatase family protein [Solirubrobacterales bacterium]|nr:alkaline phosphatase family protein [Solirubrobacterales bacterium]